MVFNVIIFDVCNFGWRIKKSKSKVISPFILSCSVLAWRTVLVFILIKAVQCYFFLSATAKYSWMSNKKQLFLLWYQVIFHIIRIAWRLCLMWFYLLFIFLLFYLNDIQVYRNNIKNDITFEYFEKYIQHHFSLHFVGSIEKKTDNLYWWHFFVNTFPL